MEEESTNSSFIDDVPRSSEACYDADTSNSSADYNLSIQEEISQATLHRSFGEAAARGAKNTASFYTARFVINYFHSFIGRVELVANNFEEKNRNRSRFVSIRRESSISAKVATPTYSHEEVLARSAYEGRDSINFIKRYGDF